jgi:hypothetical protein
LHLARQLFAIGLSTTAARGGILTPAEEQALAA